MKKGMLLALLFQAFVCSAEEASPRWKVVEIRSPAAPGSGEPSLAYGAGKVIASWLEPLPKGGHALKFAQWNGNGWNKPGTISSGSSFFVNWADFPSLVILADGTMAAHWLEKRGKSPYAYHVLISISKDGGKTWTNPLSPHRDTSETEHGFVTLIDRGKGSFDAIWLDGRNMKGHHGVSGAMQLMYSKFENDTFGPELVLDPKVCDCCQTDAVSVRQRALVVAYRDRSDKEVRDIATVRVENGKVASSSPVFRDGWEIHGCPVNGPAIAAEKNHVVVAWFTGASDQGRVRVAFSSDGGATFGKPVQIDEGNPAGRVDAVLLKDGSALVSWLENTKGKGAEIRARQVYPDLKLDPSFVVADSSNARSSGFPRMVAAEKDLFIGWTYAADPSQVRFARLLKDQ